MKINFVYMQFNGDIIALETSAKRITNKLAVPFIEHICFRQNLALDIAFKKCTEPKVIAKTKNSLKFGSFEYIKSADRTLLVKLTLNGSSFKTSPETITKRIKFINDVFSSAYKEKLYARKEV